MKQRILLAALLVAAGLQSVSAQTKHYMSVWKDNGKIAEYEVAGLDSVTFRSVEYDPSSVINGHAYVEIGGLKWATMNVGATTVAGSYETCSGDFFAWSETTPRYSSITHTEDGVVTFTWKEGCESGYSSDSNPTYTGTMLDAAHDAATANWGGSWRTPKSEEFLALA